MLLTLSATLGFLGCHAAPAQHSADFAATPSAAGVATSTKTSLPVATAGPAFAVYPGPAESYRSDRYAAKVVHNGETYDAFVLMSRNAWKDYPDKNGHNFELESMSRENHWLTCTSADPVKLLIRLVTARDSQATPVTSVQVLPGAGATARITEDGCVELSITPAPPATSYYWVCINHADGEQYPLFVLVDPPETDIPDPHAPAVRYFGPGVHEIGPHFHVGAGQIVYLAGGALVRGTIDGDGPGIRILGRGILSGEALQGDWLRFFCAGGQEGNAAKPKGWQAPNGWTPMVWMPDGCVVDGPTIIDAPHWNLQLGKGADSVVKHVKILSWNYSTDGVNPGRRGRVEECFFKVNDDVLLAYQSDIAMRNAVIWKQMNASVVQLGYGYDGARRNIALRDIQIIRDETQWQVAARGIVTMAASKGNTFANLCLENITLHGDTLNLLAIDNLNRDTPWSVKKADVTLGMVDLTLKNVIVTGVERGQYGGRTADHQGQTMRSRLRTEGSGSIRVFFDNVSMHGRKLTRAADFPNGLETAGDVKLDFR